MKNYFRKYLANPSLCFFTIAYLQKLYTDYWRTNKTLPSFLILKPRKNNNKMINKFLKINLSNYLPFRTLRSRHRYLFLPQNPFLFAMQYSMTFHTTVTLIYGKHMSILKEVGRRFLHIENYHSQSQT